MRTSAGMAFVAGLATIALAVPAAANDGGQDPAAASDLAAGAADDATILVGLEPGADASVIHDLADVGDVANSIDQIDVEVVAVAPGTTDAAITVYEGLPGVAYAEPNHELELHGEPDDPLLEDQYQLDHINAVEGFERYNDAVDAEPYAPNGGARLAILDSGIDLTHPEFQGKVADCASYLTGTGTAVPLVCQENNFHGTYVAGIAAAITDNAEGIAGVGFDAELLVYQVCTLVCFTADSAAAMVDAADAEADAANYSFGGASPNETSQRAVAYADDEGVAQVSSAGNSGGDGPDSVTFPAAYDEVMAVAATDEDFERASFSSFGPEVEVTAPGVGILSTFPGASYEDSFSGTSFSGPAVAGLAALLRNLGLDNDETRQTIIDAADPTAVGETGFTDEHGHGMADVGESVRLATSDEDAEARTPPGQDRRQGPPEGRGPSR